MSIHPPRPQAFPLDNIALLFTLCKTSSSHLSAFDSSKPLLTWRRFSVDYYCFHWLATITMVVTPTGIVGKTHGPYSRLFNGDWTNFCCRWPNEAAKTRIWPQVCDDVTAISGTNGALLPLFLKIRQCFCLFPIIMRFK